MTSFAEILIKDKKISRIPNSGYCMQDRVISDIQTYGSHDESAKIWVEGEMLNDEVYRFLGVLFGHYLSEYSFECIVSSLSGKTETQISLNRIPTIVVYERQSYTSS
ncbi:hypothetical protein BH10PAT2_BH10PAT2_0350 [soil metagenome]